MSAHGLFEQGDLWVTSVPATQPAHADRLRFQCNDTSAQFGPSAGAIPEMRADIEA